MRFNTCFIIQKEADKNRLELDKLGKIRDQLLGELAEKEKQYQAIINQLNQEKEELERNLRQEINSARENQRQETQTFQKQINEIKQDLENEKYYRGEEKAQAQEIL